MSAAFEPLGLSNGLLKLFNTDGFPTLLHGWCDDVLTLADGATYFGYVYDGILTLVCSAGSFQLKAGMYFSVPSSAYLSGMGSGLVISKPGYKGFFQVGGPIERTGRLRYMDRCTDSLLIAPILKGDPCLNLLYFPSGVDQTPHTHPSNRIGIIARGRGECITETGRVPLFPGQVFIIHASGTHSFRTDRSDMTVIAYHPDSDFGATHEDHPMINRTVVNGMPAPRLAEIKKA